MPPPTIDEHRFRTAARSEAEVLAGMAPAALQAYLASLRTLTEAALAHLALPDLLREVLSRLRGTLRVDSATVLLREAGGQSLVARASQGLEEEVEQRVEIPMGRGIAGTVAMHRQAVIVDDVARTEPVSPLVRRLSSLMAAPLVAGGEVLGVLHVGTRRPRTFRDAELHLLQVTCERAALAIRNAQLYDRAQAQLRERERMEAALAESEQRYRILAETAADAIVTMNADSVIVSANPAAGEVFGYTVEEMLGRSFTELMPERFRQAHRAGVMRYLATGKRRLPWRGLELQGLHRSGREILLEVAFAEREVDGERLFTGTMRDITERKRTERILAAQYATTRVLAEAEGVEQAIPSLLRGICSALGWDTGALWIWDGDAGVLRSPAAWSAPGLDAAEFLEATRTHALAAGVGLPGRVWQRREPAWIPRLAEDPNFPRIAAAAAVGLRSAFAFPVCVGDDCLGVMEFFTREMPETDPELLTAMEALGSDVGQFMRRREAEARAEAHEELQRFFGEVSVALSASALDYAVTLQKLVRLAVPTLGDWCSVYVRREDGAIERLEIAHADPALEPVANELKQYPFDPNGAHPALRVMQTGESILLADIPDDLVRAVAQDEEHLRILRSLRLRSAVVVPLIARGSVLGAVTLVCSREGRRYDETDLRVAEEFARRAALAVDNARLYQESQEANRAKDQFMATISHELRTPLNAVIGYTDLLRMGIAAGSEEQIQHFAERIGLSARHLTRLIEEVLEFSRLQAGRAELSLETVRLQELVEEICVTAEPLAGAKGLRLEVEVPEEPVEMVIDAGKLRHILLGVIDNAIKFTERGEIRIEAKLAEPGVVLRIRDTGIGIAPKHHERIFQPFWQVDQATTRTAGGTGLGLTVTRGLAELLGGSLEVRSALQQGTTVTLKLPLRPPPAEEAPVSRVG